MSLQDVEFEEPWIISVFLPMCQSLRGCCSRQAGSDPLASVLWTLIYSLDIEPYCIGSLFKPKNTFYHFLQVWFCCAHAHSPSSWPFLIGEDIYKSSTTLYAHFARTQKLDKTDRETGPKFRTGSLMEVHNGEIDPTLVVWPWFQLCW